MRYLLQDSGVDAPGQGMVSMHKELNQILLHEANVGRRLVLIIDEAQISANQSSKPRDFSPISRPPPQSLCRLSSQVRRNCDCLWAHGFDRQVNYDHGIMTIAASRGSG